MTERKQPVVAVISTCYNQADIVGDAIQSVIDQNTGSLDAKVLHIVCDDGSTDGSLEVLRDWEARFPHIVRVLSVTNRNMAGAFNACLMVLPDEVEYVVVLAGDDWLETNFILESLAALTPDTHMVVAGMRRWMYPGFEHIKLEMPQVRNPTAKQVWEWKTTCAWAVALFRRDVLLEAGGFHPHCGGDCDWDMWIDLTMRGYRFAYAEKTWFYYRYVATSMNRTKTREDWDAARTEMQRHHRRDTLPGPEFS